jgi:hypothetical protein
MKEQAWKLKSEITGNFFLLNVDVSESSFPPHPAVRKIRIDPELGIEGNQSGKFFIDIDFVVSTDEEVPLPNVIADVGRDILSVYIDLLSFLSGCPVRISKSPILNFNYPNTNKCRTISFADKFATITPPVPINNAIILKTKLEPAHYMVLSWFRRALQERDVVSCITQLFTALDILSNLFPCEEKMIYKCTACGFETERAGMNIKIKSLLVNHVKYTEERFKVIRDTRNDIVHGNLVLSSLNVRELNFVKQELFIAIIKGMKNLLHRDISLPPKEVSPSFSFADPILDIESIL